MDRLEWKVVASLDVVCATVRRSGHLSTVVFAFAFALSHSRDRVLRLSRGHEMGARPGLSAER